ncbi:SAGA complex subunit spt20 [Lachnellula arida]|uniref:SAGA complex subunit spt20 n=1 Tax=Lachnellula arida TaxID=1316785 RepID=A0A8T9BT77_9HELO|nr:SAGA complex subunit spt20 [Lachnellula arida]
MAPSATVVQSLSSKAKRPIPPGIQTNGIHSSTSSPSPSISAGRLPNSGKPPNSAASNGAGNNSGVRSASRAKREPGPLLGRGQRNSSVGLRSASIVGDSAAPQTAEPLPYVLSDEYILKKYRNRPPSLVVHLHPTHFRFDQQEGSFSYKSPMRVLIEHLKERTIPHELVEFLTEVPFYEGCMIVQIHDHKSTAPSQGSTRPTSNIGKSVPFSVHNYNYHITPSPWVPFPAQINGSGKGKGASEVDGDNKSKTAEQKDKENMPAPAFPGDGQRGKAAVQPKKPRISTIILRPTPLSAHIDLAMKAADSLSGGDGHPRQDGGPLSATVPPTPTTVVPPTPQSSMAPPAKRQKKNKMELNSNNIYEAEAQISIATTAPLVLDPVDNAAASAALLKSLSHPMHSEKPPSPKTRKRTVAEMAADEAVAAEQERYLLTLDERLSSNVNAQGGGNPADGDGQAGGATFEPRFEKFKAIENIKTQHEENKRLDKQRQAENDRKAQQERERERLRIESEKREADKQRATQQAQMQQNARRQQQAQQAQLQQGLQGVPPQMQPQHAHPPANNIIANGIQGQPQRFHNQQNSQAPVSSPIIRNGTPQNHSSPIVGNLGNVPMQHSTSSMGGSPPRPRSVVHQNHPQMGAQGHGMVPQRSQQSHAGTPRMPNSTPHIQSTPRQLSQTPRLSQGSPVQTPMAQAQTPMMMANGQMQMNNPNHIMRQQQMQAMLRQNAANIGMPNGSQVSPQAMHYAQAQARMIQQHQQNQQQQGGMQMGGNNNPHLAQYAAQMAAMGQQGMHQAGMGNLRSNGQPLNAQQMQIQQQIHYRMQQAQVQAQAQAQAQIQGMQQQPQQQHPQQSGGLNPIIAAQIRQQAGLFYRERMAAFQAQHPGGVTPDQDRNFRAQCQADAQAAVLRLRREQVARQAMMAQQGAAMQQNMNMQNNMPM